jgi:6-phosphogluconolactonase
MGRQARRRRCVGGLGVVLGLLVLGLYGCGGSGGSSGTGNAATSIRVVFPGQSAALGLGNDMALPPQLPRQAPSALAQAFETVRELYTVRLAYAQAIPTNVASLLLLVTGPGIQSPLQANIDLATGSVTINVPVGSDRLFEVRAFPSGSDIPNFIGRTTATVAPTGTNVTVNMQAVNLQPPVVNNPGSQNSFEGETVSLQISASDPNADLLTCSASNLPPGLTIDAASCLISGTLPFTAAGTYTVTVTVSDGILTSSVTFTWVVANTNRAPVVNSPGDQNNREGDTVAVQVTATDPDGNAVTFSASNLPPGLSIDAATGLIAGTLPFTAAGAYTVTVAASDGALSGSVTFTWIVSDVDRPPLVAAIPPQAHLEGESVTLPVVATDPDGDPLTFSATNLPPDLSIDVTTGLISGIIARTAASGSPYNVRVTVTAGAQSSFAEFTWTVVNPIPVAAAGPDQTVFIDQTVTLDGTASNDPDGDPLTYLWSFLSIPTGSRASLSDPNAPQPTFVADLPGAYDVQLIVNDGSAASAPDSVTITVNQLSLRFAYVLNQDDRTISIYAGEATTGQLRHHGFVAGVPADDDLRPESIAGDRLGRFLYVANNDSGIQGYAIDASPFSGLPPGGEGGRFALAVHPSGEFLYATDASSSVAGFTVDATTGALAPLTPTPFPVGPAPTAVAVDPTGRFLYITHASGDDVLPDLVAGFTVDATTGVLTPIAGSPFAVGNGPVALAIDPRGRFLYVANSGSNNVSGFVIDEATGALTATPGSPVTVGDNPISLAVDPAGELLYIASLEFEDDGSISGFRIDATTGALSAIPGSPFAIPRGAQAIAIDPSSRFVYVTHIFSNDVSRYAIDATTGTLTPGIPVTTRDGPLAMLLTRGTGPVTFIPRFIYAANADSNDVSGQSIDPETGALSPVSDTSFPAEDGPTSVVADPSSRFLYVANQFSNGLSAYAIDSESGILGEIAGSPFPTGSLPFEVVVDPSGRFVYVVNSFSDDVSAFTLDPVTGALTDIIGAPFSAGDRPFTVAIEPSGRFLYVVNNFSDNISAYALAPDTGTLTEIAGSPFPSGLFPTSITTDASGRFVYVTNSGSDNISAYTIDAATGALREISGSPFSTDPFPFDLSVASTSQFAYVANRGPETISAYTINAATGALSEASAPPFPTGTTPFSLTIDPSDRFLYVANRGSNDISTYTVDPLTGILTIIGLFPSAGAGPESITVIGITQ